jgi:2-oxoisovalerate dehydrogenase E1 component
MWADFLFVAIDQLVNQASNVRYVTGGKQSVPLVVRTQQGITPGSCSQHSQSIEAMLAHVPGLKVGLAATAQDAYELLRAASADEDPCIIIEARSQYQVKSTVKLTDNAQPVGVSRLRQTGKDCAVITWGQTVNEAVAAAEALTNDGINASVLDLRWLSPLDERAIADVVREAGGKVLIVHEAVRSGGFAGEIAMRIAEMQLGLPLTISRLTTPDVRIPAAPNLQTALAPDRASIAAAVRKLVADKVAA